MAQNGARRHSSVIDLSMSDDEPEEPPRILPPQSRLPAQTRPNAPAAITPRSTLAYGNGNEYVSLRTPTVPLQPFQFNGGSLRGRISQMGARPGISTPHTEGKNVAQQMRDITRAMETARPAKRRKTEDVASLRALKAQAERGPARPPPILPQAPRTITSGTNGVNSRPILPESIPRSIDYEDNPAFKLFVQKQVIPYVREALRGYRGNLSQYDSNAVGRQTMREIIGGETKAWVITEFESNQLQLSPEFERQIKRKASVLVDKFAADVLMLSMPVEGDHTIHAHSAQAHPAQPRPLQVTANQGLGMPPNGPTDSSRSTSEDERHYSSSPPTSYSHDQGGDEELSSAVNMDLDPNKTIPVVEILSKPVQSMARPVSRPPQSQLHKSSTEESATPIYKATGDSGKESTRKSSGESTVKTEPAISQRSTIPPVFPTVACQREKPTHLSDPSHKLKAMHTVQSLLIAGCDLDLQRPYLVLQERQDIQRGLQSLDERQLSNVARQFLRGSLGCTFHVDLCFEELACILVVIENVIGRRRISVDLRSSISSLMAGQYWAIDTICSATTVALVSGSIGPDLLSQRTPASIHAFLQDAAAGNISATSCVQRIQTTRKPLKHTNRPVSISSLLREREIAGLAPSRTRHGHQQFSFNISSSLEDSLVRQSEWTDCSGDLATLTWTSDNAFVCGALAHSDHFNMQYNKPGNLGVGSFSLDTLRAVPDHRIVRPVIRPEDNAENALESMRQTQDPWLYTSVVSSSHSDVNGLTFTSSFDHSVKVWNVAEDGSSITLLGTWRHEGIVDFVTASKHHNKVATASRVSGDAIRVYIADETNISWSSYDVYNGDRAQDQAQSATWAYFPATLAWGQSPSTEMLLLVGYSPRSLKGHDLDIPENMRNSGELAMWNTESCTPVNISTSHTQNVFEIIWHPTQPIFLAATSPSGDFNPTQTKLQIRLFAQTELGAFSVVKTLDCRASDINEITIMPNSKFEAYVTASCPDGNTYVWDTAQGDDPIHILGHGKTLDNPLFEEDEVGVKFVSWGQTSNRLYTGSSDGKVKAWDVRAPKGQAYVRTVLSVSGGVSCGAFSKDYSRLLIGDATGKVHFLGIDNTEIATATALSMSRNRTRASVNPMLGRRPPKVIIPYADPQPSTEETAQDMARLYLEEQHLVIHRNNPLVGVVQGPNYAETMMYLFDAHEDNDGTKPLLPDWQARQQVEIRRTLPELSLPQLPACQASSSRLQHNVNLVRDFQALRLSPVTRRAFDVEGVDLRFRPDDSFEYELGPDSSEYESD